MLVKCVNEGKVKSTNPNTKKWKKSLTNGKVYRVNKKTFTDGCGNEYYKMIDDNGAFAYYLTSRFEKL